MSINKEEILLQEYKSCDDHISRLDNLTWQTASVIFPISLAGFAYFGTTQIHTISQLFITLSVSIGSITLILTWYFLTRTWYVYQGISFYRMREIEEELELWQYRYTLYIRLRNQCDHPDLIKLKEKGEEKLNKLDKHIYGLPRLGISTTTSIITFVFVLGWLSIIIREMLLTF